MYEYQTKPFRHQRELFERTRELSAWALFWEQGTGKTKPIIDTAAYLYETGKIDAVLVVAPNGVHRNWINDECPIHMPARVREQTRFLYYDTNKARTSKRFQEELEDLLTFDGLVFLAISYNGFMTTRGKPYVKRLLTSRRCLYVLDESHHIKAPGIKRTKSILASGKYAPYRRVMTGTPVAEGPFGAYSQIRFLHPNFWFEYGLGSYALFKSYFGVWKTAQEVEQEKGYNPGYDLLLGYKNLPYLQEVLQNIADRITKEDAGLDLPPKLYTRRYFDMSPKQHAAYKQLRETYLLQLKDALIEAELAIVRLLRLQQITCGYVQQDADEPVRLIDDKNPRLEFTVEDICADLSHKAIIWCRFRHDVDQLVDALGKKAVRYDGQVSDDQAEQAKNDFQMGDAQFFVGNISKGKEGLTLHAARTVIYYSNSFKLLERMQSEDRAHRIGQEHPVNYIDVVAPGTIDVEIVRALRDKFNIQAQITGDKLKEWL